MLETVKIFETKTPESLTSQGFCRKFEITTNQITMSNLNNSSQESNLLFLEEWKPITGFENVYHVSSLGRIKSIYNRVPRTRGRFTVGKEIMLKPERKVNGYLGIRLIDKANIRRDLIHRIVLKTFKPVPNMDKLEVNHLNGVKADNRLENLEWCTHGENLSYSFTHLGRKMPNSIQIEQYDSDGVLVKRYDSRVQAAKVFNTTSFVIKNRCRRGVLIDGFILRNG